jgi:hypothetical protein
MWSATEKDQVRKELVKARDERYKIDIDEIRKQCDKIFEAPYQQKRHSQATTSPWR